MRRLILLLVLVSTSSAYATRARLRALNQDPSGSYYLLDTRNIFLNPAQIGLMKDNADFEWGKAERTGVQTAATDAEGGFITTLGGGKLGAQLGRVTDFNQLIRETNVLMADVPAMALGGAGGLFGEGQNNVDLMYGAGGPDLHWGAGLGLTRSKTATGTPTNQTRTEAYELRGGVNADRWEAFGSLLLGGLSYTDVGVNTAKFDEKYGIRVGGGFQVRPDLRIYAHLSYDKYEAQRNNGFVDYDGKRLSVLGGAAYVANLDNNARLFASVEINYLDNKATDNKSNPEEKFNMLGLPFTLGIEADANTWLRMRASVRQNVLIGTMKSTNGLTQNDNNNWENSPNNTSVAFGAGASLNKFNFDGALVQSIGDDHGRVEASMTYVF